MAGPSMQRKPAMHNQGSGTPTLLPVLSRGKHRNPRKGACFMELASYLAGERWSDHPACTHPLLAALARHVNDLIGDASRPRLAPLIPSVIGLTSDDPHVDVEIALHCATTALPMAPAESQRVMAVSVLTCNRVLAELDGLPPELLDGRSRAALAAVPHAARWAREFTRGLPISVERFQRRAAPRTVQSAVEGIARAAVPDPDAMLHDLLQGAITRAASVIRPDTSSEPAPMPAVAAEPVLISPIRWAELGPTR
jgi:hypothetical protein